MDMHDTAREIMDQVKIITPLGYKKPANLREADKDRAKFIFEQQPDLMRRKGFKSYEQLLTKYLNEPDGKLPIAPNEA
jgi:hypothetical protein